MDIIFQSTPNSDIRLQTRTNGDVEIVETVARKNGITTSTHSAGPTDKLLGVIEKSKRAEVAEWLINAK